MEIEQIFYFNDGTTSKYDDYDKIPHRVGGPAAIYDNGTRLWYFHGEFHRLDGPAVEYVDGELHWYIAGIHYPSSESFKAALSRIMNLDESLKLLDSRAWVRSLVKVGA
jgi:hypothetical protein